tara:strand:- start:2233 stop:2595 length:363 start_codon:yes stop_codon:yes gene_type:complete
VFSTEDDAAAFFCWWWPSPQSSFTSSSFGFGGGFPGTGGVLLLVVSITLGDANGNIFLNVLDEIRITAFGAAAIRSLCDTNTAHVVETNATAGRSIGGTPLDERDIFMTSKEEAFFCGYF